MILNENSKPLAGGKEMMAEHKKTILIGAEESIAKNQQRRRRIV
jgi:hypothetical protein